LLRFCLNFFLLRLIWSSSRNNWGRCWRFLHGCLSVNNITSFISEVQIWVAFDFKNFDLFLLVDQKGFPYAFFIISWTLNLHRFQILIRIFPCRTFIIRLSTQILKRLFCHSLLLIKHLLLLVNLITLSFWTLLSGASDGGIVVAKSQILPVKFSRILPNFLTTFLIGLQIHFLSSVFVVIHVILCVPIHSIHASIVWCRPIIENHCVGLTFILHNRFFRRSRLVNHLLFLLVRLVGLLIDGLCWT
jgi:hypothetical protein